MSKLQDWLDQSASELDANDKWRAECAAVALRAFGPDGLHQTNRHTAGDFSARLVDTTGGGTMPCPDYFIVGL